MILRGPLVASRSNRLMEFGHRGGVSAPV